MKERAWTQAQRNAIEAWGGTLLVSAAAGSGKTSVLSERAIRRMSDANNPIEVNRMLVVTFTRAAAAEMKGRIAQNLYERLREEPENELLQRQQILLPTAHICTIDSFCSQLVREHFEELNISPNFRFLEENEMKLLRMEIAEKVMEDQYQQNERGSAFGRLTDLVTGSRNDEELRSCILQMYDFIQSHPFPDEWLERKLEMLSDIDRPGNTPWGSVLIAHADDVAEYCLSICDKALKLLMEDDAFWEKRSPNFMLDRDCLLSIRKAALEKNWEALYKSVSGYAPNRLGTPVKRADEIIAVRTKAMREEIKAKLSMLKKSISAGEDGFREDLCEHYKLSEALFYAVRDFGERYSKRKREMGAVDFPDLIHMAIKLLVTPGGNGWTRTQLAEALSMSYDEIMVDEYQDTNEAQDLMFRALSRNEENLFFVGDVKQSIYGFRQATPALFLERYKSYPIYDPEKDSYPARIMLDRNFRSRNGVTDNINFLFRQLMSVENGGLQYAEGEELIPAAEYPEHNEADMELHIVRRGESDRHEEEALYIVSRIRDMIDQQLIIQDKDTGHPLRYGDICVLLRKGKGTADKYVRVLEKHGIPAWAEESGGFFETPEITSMISLLKIIDNPNQDIPLLAVMLSPIYGFTNAEMARLRSAHPGVSLYYAVRAAAEENKKAAGFLESLSRLRTLSATLPVDTLMERIYEQTGYTAIVQAMKNGGQRLSNLRLLQEYARSYAENGKTGLPSFVRFMDRMAENGLDFSQSSSSSEVGNVVRVITIHHSKGLEFPVCFLADSVYKHKGKNNSNILLHSGLGLGARHQDFEGLVRYATLPYEAVKLALEKESVSEELRILYVALTRAKEKLIVTAMMDNPEKELTSLAERLTDEPVLQSFSVRELDSMAKWIISCAFRHPSADELRKLTGYDTVLPCTAPLDIIISQVPDEDEIANTVLTEGKVSDELLSQLAERFSYEYEGREGTRIPSKVAVTELVDEQERIQWKYKTRPHFLRRDQLTPSERGTAMHKYMQYARYESAAVSPELELKRLVEQKFLTPDEGKVIDIDSITAFFQSDLGQRILSAHYEPEMRFQIRIPANMVMSGLTSPYDSQSIVLNGVVDCVLEEPDGLVIIDYKTSHMDEEDAFAEHYKRQLEIYARSIEECMGKIVKEKIIYSFHLRKSINV